MWERSCDHEAAVRNMARQNRIDAALRGHIARCDVCRETLAVTDWMQAFAAASVDESRLPDPAHLWWKAELLRRWDAQQRAAAPIEIGERVQVGLGLVGAVAMLIWLWRDAARLTTSLSNDSLWGLSGLGQAITAATIVTLVILLGIGVLTVREFFERERA